MTAKSALQSGSELRVHGVGNHAALSAQGRPLLVSGRPKLGVFEAPAPVTHEVRMLSWTPSSRSVFSVVWWLALPFTLVNVAGHMAPQTGAVARGVHRLSTCVVSTVLAVGSLVWGIAICERVAMYIGGLDRHPRSAVWIVWGVTAVLVTTILFRVCVKRRVRGRSFVVLAISQALLVVATAATVVRLRPATMPWPTDWFSTCWAKTSSSCVTYLDTPTAFAASSIGLSLVLAAVATVVHGVGHARRKGRPEDDRGYPSLVAAATLLVVAVTLLNSAWSLVRAALGWILIYLDKVPSAFTVFSRAHGLQTADRFLTPDDRGLSWFNIQDSVPIFAVGGLLSGLVVVLVVLRATRNSGDKPWAAVHARYRAVFAGPDGSARVPASVVDDVVKAEAMHNLVGSLTQRLVGLTLLSSMVWALWVAVMIATFRNATSFQKTLIVFGDHVLILASALTILSLSLLPVLRSSLGVIGDVAGYWDIAWSPLAGTPYAPDVVDQLKTEIVERTGPLVLVGHSQGSVICFAVVDELDAGELRREPPVSLLTCGSPLVTLYHSFFPIFFGRDSFERVAAKLARPGAASDAPGWVNVWRHTDPIASPMPPSAHVHEVPLLDVPDWNGLQQHSDYWTAAPQARAVELLLAGREGELAVGP